MRSHHQPYIEATLKMGSAEELQELFQEVHPADLAEALEELDDSRWDEVLAAMPAETFAYLIEHIPSQDVQEHLENSSKEFRQQALEQLPDDELVDLLQDLPDQQRDDYVGLLSEEVKETSRKLMAFPETSAGGRMTTDIAKIREHLTIEEAIQQLAEVKETTELLARIYVVDERDRLQGKLRLRDLTFNPGTHKIHEVMDRDLMSIDAYADQEEAARMIARYDLMALPVINAEREVLGIITHDDALEILEEETSEDMERFSGIQPFDDGYLRTSVIRHVRNRLVWVAAMALLGILAGCGLYPILALYLTTVVASGGNTGSQASTMVIRAMSLGECQPRDFWEVLWKEIRVGLILGGAVGLLIFAQITLFNFVPKA